MKIFGSSRPLILLAFGCLFFEGVSSFTVAPRPKSLKKFGGGALDLASTTASFSSSALPRISEQHLQELAKEKFVIIPNFLPADLQDALQDDVSQLRDGAHFKIAKIGQDSTNTLNQEIRVAETCFIDGTTKRNIPTSSARSQLVTVLEQACEDLSANALLGSPKLDKNLLELLYAYYPQGGFYRRHRDAIPGSASVLRTYSLLVYLNKDWTEADGGYLRMHMDSGGDELPPGEEPNFLDVAPKGGTLVLFESDKIPHEVLDTNSERLAIVGWYNRELSVADMSELGVDTTQLAILGIAAALVTVGLVSLLS